MRPAASELESHDDEPTPETHLSNPVVRVLILVVRGYQHLASGRPSPCRFEPTCSTYAIEALTLHGATKGSWLTARRLIRCRPFGRFGFDLVPPAKEPHLPC